MKTTFKFLAIPILGFALASAGAVSTSNYGKSKAALPPMTAYINQSVCQPVPVTCNLTTGPTCLFGTSTAWAKDAQGRCIVPLHQDLN